MGSFHRTTIKIFVICTLIACIILTCGAFGLPFFTGCGYFLYYAVTAVTMFVLLVIAILGVHRMPGSRDETILIIIGLLLLVDGSCMIGTLIRTSLC